jgi:hypothetical protein
MENPGIQRSQKNDRNLFGVGRAGIYGMRRINFRAESKPKRSSRELLALLISFDSRFLQKQRRFLRSMNQRDDDVFADAFRQDLERTK